MNHPPNINVDDNETGGEVGVVVSSGSPPHHLESNDRLLRKRGGGAAAAATAAAMMNHLPEIEISDGDEEISEDNRRRDLKGALSKYRLLKRRNVMLWFFFVVVIVRTFFFSSTSLSFDDDNNSSLTTIPKLIWFTAKESSIEDLPTNHKQCVESWKRLNPTWEIRYHNDSQAEEFMCGNDQRQQKVEVQLKSEYCDVYRKLPIPVMKADMWRYAVLYVHGGFYADINAENLIPIDEYFNNRNTRRMVNIDLDRCGLWAGQENNYHLCQWTLAAKPGNKALESVLDLIVQRFQQRDHDVHFQQSGFVHEFTGPKVFTDGVEAALSINFRIPFIPSSWNYYIQTWRIRFAAWIVPGSDFCIAPQSSIRYNPREGYTTSFIHNHFEWHTGWVGQAKDLQHEKKKKSKNTNK